jgi:hypothetical protein
MGESTASSHDGGNCTLEAMAQTEFLYLTEYCYEEGRKEEITGCGRGAQVSLGPVEPLPYI